MEREIAYVDKGTDSTVDSRLGEVGILEDHGTRLAAKLHEDRLEMLSCERRDNPANFCATRKVDLLHGRLRNETLNDPRCVRWPMEDEIETSVGETSFSEHVGYCPIAAGRQFRAL